MNRIHQNLSLEGHAGAHYLLAHRTTAVGNRTHTVITSQRDLAFAIYEEALEVDIEPDIAAVCGTFTIEFVCADTECYAALLSASRGFTA